MVVTTIKLYSLLKKLRSRNFIKSHKDFLYDLENVIGRWVYFSIALTLGEFL